MKNYIPLLLLLTGFASQAQKSEKIKFKSDDGLEVVADLYMMHPDTARFIIFFHQAGWSRGEYNEIAPMMNHLGYNCLAVDQRSGNAVNGIKNETAINAKAGMKETQYIHAISDMLAAIGYVRKYLTKEKLIIWGSSYSSSLVLKIAGDEPEICDAVMAFSPGEYFSSAGKPADFIQKSAANIMVPVFITSARNEKGNWWKIYEAIPSVSKTFFLPKASGFHGSRALWQNNDPHKEYRNAVIDFLAGL